MSRMPGLRALAPSSWESCLNDEAEAKDRHDNEGEAETSYFVLLLDVGREVGIDE